MRATWKRLLEQGRVERHATTARELQDLRAVVERDLQDAAYFGVGRRKRNILSCENAEVASATEVTKILRETRRPEALVEGWIARRHPALAR